MADRDRMHYFDGSKWTDITDQVNDADFFGFMPGTLRFERVTGRPHWLIRLWRWLIWRLFRRGQSPISPLTNLYAALHTADPTSSGNQFSSEVTYTGYARVAATLSPIAGDSAPKGSHHVNDANFLGFMPGTVRFGVLTCRPHWLVRLWRWLIWRLFRRGQSPIVLTYHFTYRQEAAEPRSCPERDHG